MNYERDLILFFIISYPFTRRDIKRVIIVEDLCNAIQQVKDIWREKRVVGGWNLEAEQTCRGVALSHSSYSYSCRQQQQHHHASTPTFQE